MSKIQVSNELMKNQKAASVLPPQSLFESMQDTDGNAMFFSIGDDKVFNLTIEKSGIKTGWEAIDLSSELRVFHNNKSITAQTFSVTQNYDDGNITIALVVRADGETSDTLYIFSSLSNAADASWISSSAARNWLARPYDDTQHPLDSVSIAYVYLTPTQKESLETQLVAEVRSDTTEYIQNYTVNLTGNNAWAVLQTAENFDSVLGQVIGRPEASSYAGLYQLTSLNDGLTIDFIPMQSIVGPPTITKMKAPDGATKLAAVTVNDQNVTNLFVSAKDGLYLFTPDKQVNFGEAVKVVDNPIFAGTQKLYAHQSSAHTIIWGLNQQGEIFYSRCAKGQEGVATAWSYPVPILSGVEQITSFLNQQSANSVIFAHTQGQEIIQLTQDPQTTNWHQRKILLPSPNINDVVEYNTFSTHIQLAGDDKLPLSESTLSITSSSQCSVFVNDVYHILSPDIETEITTDATGTVTIIQETQGLGAVCYHLTLKSDGTEIDVNPMTKLVNIVSRVKNGDDLANVTIANADGSTQKLVPSGTSRQDTESTAMALQHLNQISAKMPQDGSLKSARKARTFSEDLTSFVVQPDTIWGLSFGSDGIKYHESAAAMTHYGLQLNTTRTLMAVSSPTIQLYSIWDAIETTAGDAFSWLKHAFEDVTQFFVKVVDDVYHFFIELGGQLFRFVMDCVSDVVHAIEFVLNKIKIFIEDLIKWLGFLFQWQDIIRTHNVLKNIFKQYLAHSIQQIDTYKTDISGAFKDVEKRLNKWADLESLTGSLSEQSGSSSEMDGQNDPQSHWGTYHLKNNASSSNADVTASTGTSSQLEELMKTLSNAITEEGNIFQKAFYTLQTEVLDQIQNLSAGDIIKRIIAIIGDLLIESVENIVVSSIDIMEVLVEGVLAVLDTPVDIPVISWLYKEITGNDLSLLDVLCLVIAIPSTLIYKLAHNKAPYPDNAFTSGLTHAGSWQELQKMFNPSTVANNNQERLLLILAKDSSPESAAPNANTQQNGDAEVTIRILRISATFSSIAFIGLSIAKAVDDDSKAVSVLHGICFFTTTGPNIAESLVASTDQRWDKILSEVVYSITALEKLIDIFTYKKETNTAMKSWAEITKWVDFVLGLAGFVPTIASVSYEQDAKTITAMIGNACWNANRMTTPFANIKDTPKIFAAKMVLIGLYGLDQGFLSLSNT